MYKIDSFTLKQYVEDEWIKMPRFQRAKTWKTKQKFELALSIFKRYPLGCVILCSESDKGSGTQTRWLIDGRQRFTTIKEMFKNPVVIYDWARSYLSIKSNSTVPEIEEKFWKKVSEFTNYDPNDKSDDVEENITDDETSIDDIPVSEDDIEETKDLNSKDSNLANLLELIIFCHIHKDSKNYGLTQVFNISKFVAKNNKYSIKFLAEGSSDIISCVKIKNLISAYKEYCRADKKDYKDKNNYIQYLDMEFNFISDAHKNKYLEEKLNDWDNKQLKAIKFFEIVDSVLNNTFLAVISVEDASSTDEQKIFNLINSNGTPLTAAEVLSAKPSWNKPLGYVSQDIKNAIVALYKDRLENEDIDPNKCVRWDLPACLPSLLKNFEIFFPLSEYTKEKAGKATTLGFKIYSGIILDGIKKEDLDELSNSPKVNGQDFEDFVYSFNAMLTSIAEIPYFATLKSWKLSLSKIIGDAPVLTFLFEAYHMYLIEEKPHSGSSSFDVFKKNCFIILDNLIYEYINSVWRGTGDAILRQRIKAFKATYSKGKIIVANPYENWEKLLDGIIENNQIDEKLVTLSFVKPIVVHYNCIKRLKCAVDYDFVPEFDHIIPQSSFKSSTIENKELLRDNIYNIALLPKSKNAAKNDRSLKAIDDEVLIAAITQYEEIKEEDFSKYCKPTDIDDLKQYRGKMVKEAFKTQRKQLLESN